MDSIIKGFVGVFFALVVVVLGTGIISASIEARNAGLFATDSAARIGNSNFSGTVVEDCRADAQARGYDLSVDITRPSDRRCPVYGKLKLQYRYRLPILRVDRVQEITADIL